MRLRGAIACLVPIVLTALPAAARGETLRAAMGAAASPDLPFFDRGTGEQSLALGRR